jgi:hypothetical protein
MYDLTQTDGEIKDGDLFICNGEKTIGFLMKAWPTVIEGERGELEQATSAGLAKLKIEYAATFDLAKSLNLTKA